MKLKYFSKRREARDKKLITMWQSYMIKRGILLYEGNLIRSSKMKQLRLFLNILIFICASAILVSLFIFNNRIFSNLFLILLTIFKLIEWKYFYK